MLKTRVISAIIGLPILFFIMIKGGTFLTIALVLISILGLNEFYNATKNLGIRPVKIFGYLSAILLYLLEGKIAEREILVIIAMMLFLLFLTNKKYNLKDYALTLLGIIYIPLFFLYIQNLEKCLKEFI